MPSRIPPGSNQGQAVGSSGWYYNNVRASGTAGIDGTYSKNGNGSVHLSGPANAKAHIEFVPNAAAAAGDYNSTSSLGLFSAFVGMSYDWYRSSSSVNNARQIPALRILLDADGDLGTTGDRGGLVFERVYNEGADQSPAPTNAWTHESIGANTFVWNSDSASRRLPTSTTPTTATTRRWRSGWRTYQTPRSSVSVQASAAAGTARSTAPSTISPQREPRVAGLEWLDLDQIFEVDDVAAMHAQEALRNEPRLERRHRRAQRIQPSLDVRVDLVAFGFEPLDIGGDHEFLAELADDEALGSIGSCTVDNQSLTSTPALP